MAKIELKGLHFAYPGQDALFEDISIILDSDWRLGLVGRNGRGKTTLLKLISGRLAVTGEILTTVDFVNFPQNVNQTNRISYQVAEDIVRFEQWQLERELNLLKVNPEILWRPFQELSGGEQTKLLLALLFLAEGKTPLIDEPTNHLDIDGRTVVANYLQKKAGFILVSHDRAFLNRTCNRILAIEKNQLKLYQGNFSVYEAEKAMRDQSEIAENDRLKSEITRLKQTAADKKQWSNHREGDKYGKAKIKNSRGNIDTGFIGARSARTMQKAKNLERRMSKEIEGKAQLLKNIETVEDLTINYQPTHRHRLIEAENFSLSFANQPLFQPLSFEVNSKTQLAIVGANGAGKTSLFKAISGTFLGQQLGELSLATNLKISYVRQNYQKNTGNLKAFSQKHGLDYTVFLNNLKKLGMERAVFSQKIETMSMGQRKKVEIAKSLAEPAELYLWDEPLNYLDVYNRMQLKELLLRVQPPLIMIEHDQVFIEQLGAIKLNIKKI